MSTDIRASLSLTTMATQAARSDSGAQNQILDIGSDAGFPQILEQQANARAESRAAPANDSSRTRERDEAATRQSGGKRLPAGPDRAGERRAEARRTDRADAREREDAAASRDADASHEAQSARRSAEDIEEQAASAEEKDSAGNGNDAEVAPPVDPAVTPPVVIPPESTLALGGTDAIAQDGEAVAVSEVPVSDVPVQAPSASVEAAVLPVTETVALSATAVGDGQDQATASGPAAATGPAGVDAGLLQAATAQQEAEALAALEMAAAAVTDAELAPAIATATQQATLSAAATTPAADAPAPQPSTLAANAGQSAPAALSSTMSPPETAQRAGNETPSSILSAQSGALSAEEGDALSAEAGPGDKSAGNGADSDKGNRATPERVAAFREQLAVLAQQVDAGNRAAASTSAKKSDTLQDVKGFALTRNMEQLSTARADAGKAASTGIQTPLSSREWAGEVGQRLLMMVSSKIKSAEIHLNPKELGPMEVRIRMHEDKAHVVFTSQVAQTREALEQAMPRLREMLDQNGVTLGNVNVQDHGAQHSHQRQQHDQHAGGNVQGQLADDESDVAPVIRRDLSLVDFYA